MNGVVLLPEWKLPMTIAINDEWKWTSHRQQQGLVASGRYRDGLAEY
jgi:hypothetical protein